MTIHTFGDANCYCGWHGVNSHYIGPEFCYSFGRRNLSKYDIMKYDVKRGDTIVLCFGERDCKYFIHQHIKETRLTYQQIIDDTVEKYFETIHLKITYAQIELKHVCIYNVIPPVYRDNTFDSCFYEMPSNEEKKKYTLYFNKKLKEKCDEYGFIFFDIYDKYVNMDGYLDANLSDNRNYIKNGKYINEFRQKYLDE